MENHHVLLENQPSMAIFNSYVKLPEGTTTEQFVIFKVSHHMSFKCYNAASPLDSTDSPGLRMLRLAVKRDERRNARDARAKVRSIPEVGVEVKSRGDHRILTFI